LHRNSGFDFVAGLGFQSGVFEQAAELVAPGAVAANRTVVAVGSEIAVLATHGSASSVFAKKAQQ
jgi:hypothetical protein